VRLRSEAELVSDLADVDESLLMFGEHTWGSWETYSKPHSTFSHSHWNAKAAFAYEAYDLARDLAIEGMFRLAASGSPAPGDVDGHSEEIVDGILVVNPTERPRREPVEVEIDGHRRVRTVAAAPAFGTAVVPVPPPLSEEEGYELALGAFRVQVDPRRGGVVSLVDTRTGRELVDGTVPHGLGALVVEQVAPGARHPMLDENPKLFRPENPGPEFVRRPAVGDRVPTVSRSADVARITWRGAAAGVPAVATTLTLYANLDVVDLDVDLVKPERLGPESIFVAFPFDLPSPRFLLETAGAVYEAEREQLPDTSKDWYSIQHAIGVVGGEHGILWGSFDAPLVQLGGFHTGEWARRLEVAGGHVNSWLMNNLHFTNYQAQQEGTRRYRYRFAPAAGPITPERVAVYGRDLLEPLQGRHYTGPVASGPSGLRVEPADRLLAEVRPVGAGTVRVRLRNPGDAPVDAVVSWAAQQQTVAIAGHQVADVTLPIR
jgi:alpha-mannosidase